MRNVTLSLPEPLLRKLKVYAARNDRSMSSVMIEAVSKIVESESQADRDWEWLKSKMGTLDLGTNGKIPWKREDLYDRGVR